jgi:hypothetical protein
MKILVEGSVISLRAYLGLTTKSLSRNTGDKNRGYVQIAGRATVDTFDKKSATLTKKNIYQDG